MASAQQIIRVSPWKDRRFYGAIFGAPLVVLIFISFYQKGQFGASSLSLGMLAVLCFAYPVMEEIVFRGGLQAWLASRTWGHARLGPCSLANFFTSLVFTAFHFISHPPLLAAMVFFPSLVFGFFRDLTCRDATHGLAVPIVLHCWYNLIFFLLTSGLFGS